MRARVEKKTIGSVPAATAWNDEETLDVCAAAQSVTCFESVLRVLTGKWKGQILWRLTQRRMRFGELLRSMPGITQHMLTTQLRDLESHGLLTRTVYAEVPPRVEYDLTPAAHDLRPVFAAIVEWSRQHGEALNLPDEGSTSEAKG